MPPTNGTNKPPNEIPSATEFGLWRSFCARQGYKQTQIDQAIGTGVDNRSRLEIGDDQRVWLKNG